MMNEEIIYESEDGLETVHVDAESRYRRFSREMNIDSHRERMRCSGCDVPLYVPSFSFLSFDRIEACLFNA
jgi:hypothetical protein